MIKSFSPFEFELYFQYQNEDPRWIWEKKRFWNTNTSPQSINWLRLVFTASRYPIDWTRIADWIFNLMCFTLSMRLNCVYRRASCIYPFFFSFFLSSQFSRDYALFCRSHALFTGPTSTLFKKKTLKLGPTVLFIHLKIILLMFSVFNFQQNKQYLNGL